MLIELLGYKYSLETKRFRDVDNFPKGDLERIKKTFITDLSQSALLEKLRYLIDIIYDEFDSHYRNVDLTINRYHIYQYIAEVFK